MTSLQSGADQVVGRRRDERLAAVRRAGDPDGQDDVQAVVDRLREPRLAGMNADADADGGALRPLRRLPEPLLHVHRPAYGIARAAEREEERIALGVDLLAPVLFEGGTHETMMLFQELPVAVSELVYEPRRSLDVREQEGDRAGRDLGRPGRRERRRRRRRERLVLHQDRPLESP